MRATVEIGFANLPDNRLGACGVVVFDNQAKNVLNGGLYDGDDVIWELPGVKIPRVLLSDGFCQPIL
jgi:hypothetical protein